MAKILHRNQETSKSQGKRKGGIAKRYRPKEGKKINSIRFHSITPQNGKGIFKKSFLLSKYSITPPEMAEGNSLATRKEKRSKSTQRTIYDIYLNDSNLQRDTDLGTNGASNFPVYNHKNRVLSPDSVNSSNQPVKKMSKKYQSKVKINKIKNKCLINRNNSSERKIKLLTQENKFSLKHLRTQSKIARAPFTSVNLRMDHITKKSGPLKNEKRKNYQRDSCHSVMRSTSSKARSISKPLIYVSKEIHQVSSLSEEIESLQMLLSESCQENYKLKCEIVKLDNELHQRGIKQELELSNLQMKLKLMEEALNKSNSQIDKLKPLPYLLDKYELKLTEYQNEIDLREIKIQDLEEKKGIKNHQSLDDLEERIQFLIKELERCRNQLEIEAMKEPMDLKQSRIRIDSKIDYLIEKGNEYISSEDDSLSKEIRKQYDKAINCHSKIEMEFSSLI
ncbi:unnamed protein product [Moneuplotes crassus]|uniref:Uncharacterized protein n=1 Tax=Euplotes crassus TaxID=5936 RepID=A0AAD1UCJ0_EUPCR|nr:unnamed protein product [Moneuplotes crassus]